MHLCYSSISVCGLKGANASPNLLVNSVSSALFSTHAFQCARSGIIRSLAATSRPNCSGTAFVCDFDSASLLLLLLL
jgi:hypothetical protein